jgi:hypothetical protein
MSVTIAGIEFETHEYDARGDVLYLSVDGNDAGGLPSHADATPEGHGIAWDEGLAGYRDDARQRQVVD